jgi:hypothetical protein
METPVSKLPRCGVKTVSILHTCGIHTLGELLAYTGAEVTGINWGKLRGDAHKLVDTPRVVGPPAPGGAPVVNPHLLSLEHSWQGLCSHIMLPTRIKRARLGAAMVTRYGLVLRASYVDARGVHHRSVTPQSVAAAYVLWHRQDVMSDDEMVDEEPEVDPLPSFTIEVPDDAVLCAAQTDMVNLAVREVQAYQYHSVSAL